MKGPLKSLHPIAESTPVFAVPKLVKVPSQPQLSVSKPTSTNKVEVPKAPSVPEDKSTSNKQSAECQAEHDIVQVVKAQEPTTETAPSKVCFLTIKIVHKTQPKHRLISPTVHLVKNYYEL